jgi:hypothetical protein
MCKLGGKCGIKAVQQRPSDGSPEQRLIYESGLGGIANEKVPRGAFKEAGVVIECEIEDPAPMLLRKRCNMGEREEAISQLPVFSQQNQRADRRAGSGSQVTEIRV